MVGTGRADAAFITFLPTEPSQWMPNDYGARGTMAAGIVQHGAVNDRWVGRERGWTSPT